VVPAPSDPPDPPGYRRRTYRETLGQRVVPPHPSRVDLHTHTNRSDGVMAPADLVAAAAAVGVRVLAIADHDTLAGVREMRGRGAQPAATILPLELLPAVEINSIARGIPDLWEGELHVLGLGVDPDDDAFEAVLERQRGYRAERFRRMVDRLRDLRLPVNAQVEALMAGPGAASGASLGRPQLGRCLVAAGFAESVDDAMKRLLGHGRPAYVPREGLGPFEAIEAIRAAGGVPSLAHFWDAAGRRELVSELASHGLAGLEVHYRHFDVETVSSLASAAADLRLIPTGGSDYHGDMETYAEAHAALYVPDEDAMSLYAQLGRPSPTLLPGSAPA
jgi:predicted metal-dependent phosphoesterase TrpH